MTRFASLIAMLLLLAACGGGLTGGGPAPTPSATASDALRQDAAQMATDIGIPLDEAIRRLQVQDSGGVAELEQRLSVNEVETFAGLWLQQEPEYRVVVAFTRAGEETMRPYLVDSPIAPLIEVRSATVSLAELSATQMELSEQLRAAGAPVDSGINVQANQVELYLTDRARFDQAVAEANITIPPHVSLQTIYEPAAAPPPALTPEPTVHMAQLQVRSGAFMEVLLEGTLVVENGCLAVAPEEHPPLLLIWQPDFFLSNRDGTLEVLDRDGNVVGRVGARITTGGGAIPLTPDLESQLRATLPPACRSDQVWVMGNEVALE